MANYGIFRKQAETQEKRGASAGQIMIKVGSRQDAKFVLFHPG